MGKYEVIAFLSLLKKVHGRFGIRSGVCDRACGTCPCQLFDCDRTECEAEMSVSVRQLHVI